LGDATQRWLVVIHRRFGTTYRSHLQESLEDGTDRLSRNFTSKWGHLAISKCG